MGSVFKHVGTVFAGGLLFSLTAHALSIKPVEFDQIVTQSDLAFKGVVTGTRCEKIVDESGSKIVTYVTFRVLDDLKGRAGKEQTLRFLGGIVGDEGMEVKGMPQFVKGDTDVVFTEGNGKNFCPLYAAHMGRYRIREDKKNQAHVYMNDGRAMLGPQQVAVESKSDRRLSGEPMTYDQFRAEVMKSIRPVGEPIPTP